MRRSILLVMGLVAIPVAGLTCDEAKPMTENEKYLKETRERIEAFETELEPERLRESYMALENVNLASEHAPKTRARLRTDSLSLWMRLLRILDDHLDPRFDADDVPMLSAHSPITSQGTVYPPGADPALIHDPVARAEYEKGIAANQAKAIKYGMQIDLGRLNERITPRAEAFILDSYTQAPADQEEVRTAIEKTIKDPRRKAKLLKLVRPAQP